MWKKRYNCRYKKKKQRRRGRNALKGISTAVDGGGGERVTTQKLNSKSERRAEPISSLFFTTIAVTLSLCVPSYDWRFGEYNTNRGRASSCR